MLEKLNPNAKPSTTWVISEAHYVHTYPIILFWLQPQSTCKIPPQLVGLLIRAQRCHLLEDNSTRDCRHFCIISESHHRGISLYAQELPSRHIDLLRVVFRTQATFGTLSTLCVVRRNSREFRTTHFTFTIPNSVLVKISWVRTRLARVTLEVLEKTSFTDTFGKVGGVGRFRCFIVGAPDFGCKAEAYEAYRADITSFSIL
mmetsp:Transcript_102713/g.178183  ORF Transcript_102713/g.178183 Transcript_102713/m.178183 type:complete len:202 (-) Transcript_102713:279-884(-)